MRTLAKTLYRKAIALPVATLACLAVACGQPKPAIVAPADTGIAPAPDAGSDATPLDDAAVPGDTAAVALTCPQGPDCPCAGNGECNSALCLETPTGKQCARTCIDACPTGFACAAVDSGAGDVLNVCVPRFGHLCDPCTTSKDCKSVGLSGSACVEQGGLGRFCGVACSQASDCPADFTCKPVPATEGQNVSQCVRKPDGDGAAFGTCACSAAAKAEVLGTACQVATSYAGKPVSCAGKRTCTAAGLSACVLAPLGPEVCDGGDNDCNGQTDEGACDDGQFCTQDACNGAKGCSHLQLNPTPCDDGDPCTDGDVCQAGACKPGKSICLCSTSVDCPDTDLCAGKHFCDESSHTCQIAPGTAVTCATAGPCHASVCEPKTGTCQDKLLSDGSACDDGDGCTSGESCQAGVCGGGANLCECKVQADCVAKEDGDLCNGTLYCEPTSHTCLANPASVVTCPAASGPCSKQVCTAKTGVCSPVPLPDGATCDADGNACTTGDTCQQGQCTAGTNTCTCKTTADCAGQEDGDLCNGTLFCNLAKSTCELNPATTVTCPTVNDTACRSNVCAPKTGQCALQPVPGVAKPCDDGNACTIGEVCDKGQCLGGTNTCACSDDAGCAKYADGDLCNGTMYCDKTQNKCAVNPATVVVCPSVQDSACLMNACVPTTGLCAKAPVNEGGSCDADGNGCTAKDTCSKGACVADTNVCSCQKDGDCPDDGNLCNGLAYCDQDKHVCVLNPASLVSCPNVLDTDCVRNLCQPLSGKCAMTGMQDGAACSDGNACTAGDGCAAGVCKPGTMVCLCKQDGDCAKFEDGDSCNGTLYCDKAACKVNPAKVVVCQTGLDNACVKHVCQVKTGQCQEVLLKNCDDGNPCTADSCDKTSGCVHVGGQFKAESCNGVDDDCDGGTDETFAQKDQACDGNGDGCKAGKMACVAGLPACTAETAKAGDACDQNSDGCKTAVLACPGGTALACDIESGVVGEKCGAGPCSGGKFICKGDKVPLGCSSDGLAIAEVCDGIDNDCNGWTDNGCDDDKDHWCDANMLYLGYTGECNKGPGDCDDTNLAVNTAQAENCTTIGVDDNCSGVADEGCCAKKGFVWPACTGCLYGWVSVATNAGNVCAPDVPVWGIQPISPVGLSQPTTDTVFDGFTGLTWELGYSGTTMDWATAKTYCLGRTTAGKTDWRLPTLAELVSIVDYATGSPAAPAVFGAIPSTEFWTVVPWLPSASAWLVDFFAGDSQLIGAANSRRVRCVR